MLQKFLIIGLGGFFGACLRYFFSITLKHFTILNVKLSTGIINILGSFILGLFLSYSSKSNFSDNLKEFVIIGILGAFTTFSTFSFEAFMLLDDKKYVEFFVYLFLNVILGIVAFAIGYKTLN